MAANPVLNRGVIFRDTDGTDYAATIIRTEEGEGNGKVQLAVMRPLAFDEPVERLVQVEFYPEQKPEGARGVPGRTWRYPRRTA